MQLCIASSEPLVINVDETSFVFRLGGLHGTVLTTLGFAGLWALRSLHELHPGLVVWTEKFGWNNPRLLAKYLRWPCGRLGAIMESRQVHVLFIWRLAICMILFLICFAAWAYASCKYLRV